MNDSRSDIERVCHDEWGRVLALLVARCRDIDDAEEALADAFEAAVRTWPRDGTPRQPAAWLLTVARRRLADQARATDVARRKLPLLVVDQALTERAQLSVDQAVADQEIPDERLRLALLCCHPALAPEAQVALVLRLVLGLSTAEVARLFLVSEVTMAARLTRAKQRIARSAIPLALPDADRLADRIESAVRAAHLAFVAGSSPESRGDPPASARHDLAAEGVRLARLLVSLAPTHGAARALLALVVLQHARRDARVDPEGRLVLLADQDRGLWRRDEIAEGARLLRGLVPETAFAQELALQAHIAAAHDLASGAAATDWDAIADLYAVLEQLTGNPVVRLNRAVAVAEQDARGPCGPEQGAAAGLALLEGLEDHLPGNHRLPAVRAELLVRAGCWSEALTQYDLAIGLCRNGIELTHLKRHRDRAAAATARG